MNSNIRAERARRGIKNRELAEHLGFSPEALWRRMSGAVAWNLDELDSVAELLGTTTRELLRP